MSTEKDAVDRIVAQWDRERPELDTGPMAVIGRLHRLADLLEGELRTVFAPRAGQRRLRRAGRAAPCGRAVPAQPGGPGRQHDGDLGRRHQAGGPTGAEGLVKRSVSAADGRGREIELTARARS